MIHRLVLRELRTLFQRIKRASSRQNEPQNIWEGNYFRDLDEYIEEDNQRLQEILRNTLPHPHRLRFHPTPPSVKSLNRNQDLFYSILNELNLHVSLVKRTIFIHKEYGMFEINMGNANVHFIPSHCLGCQSHCRNKKRHICIVNNDSWRGWANFDGITPLDLLILSKVIALENDWIPINVKNQINRSFFCKPLISAPPQTSLGLRDQMLEEVQRLRDLFNQNDDNTIQFPLQHGTLPPPRLHINHRALIMNELRNLFRRARNWYPTNEANE